MACNRCTCLDCSRCPYLGSSRAEGAHAAAPAPTSGSAPAGAQILACSDEPPGAGRRAAGRWGPGAGICWACACTARPHNAGRG
jgi:hypothetical protein